MYGGRGNFEIFRSLNLISICYLELCQIFATEYQDRASNQAITMSCIVPSVIHRSARGVRRVNTACGQHRAAHICCGENRAHEFGFSAPPLSVPLA